MKVAGCTDPAACNAADFTDTDNSLCVYALDLNGIDYVDCDGNCYNDADGDGVCDEDEIPGCTDELANNYESDATDDDAFCTGCTNPIADNYYAGADIDDGTCVISGCTDAEACNYFDQANNEDGSCQYPIDLFGDEYVGCDNCLNDLDGDGLCNEEESLRQKEVPSKWHWMQEPILRRPPSWTALLDNLYDVLVQFGLGSGTLCSCQCRTAGPFSFL